MTSRVAKKRAKEYCRRHNLPIIGTKGRFILVEPVETFEFRQFGPYMVCTERIMSQINEAIAELRNVKPGDGVPVGRLLDMMKAGDEEGIRKLIGAEERS